MSTTDRIAKETSGCGTISLYRQGLFWKAYQQSAWRLFKEGYARQAVKRIDRRTGKPVVTVSLRTETLEKLAKDKEVLQIGERYIRFEGSPMKNSDYVRWAASLPEQKRQQPATRRITAEEADRVFYMLSSRNIEEMTPLECMQLLARIQKMLGSEGITEREFLHSGLTGNWTEKKRKER